ncbi:gastrula zinc finger protein XlCGF49.1-like [Rana temporaria]|uniref:gastrula zinc finger protein XlCGF49.1-like n=1 Tax=Rana temporaria TaxID=8407 RepID=UPI001AAD4198|nr:gastrula zinc finger protein XlCGF49.1-like [Rana temporaria]
MGIKPDVTDANCYQLSVEEAEMMVTITKEDVSSGGANVRKTPEGRLITVTQNIHHKLDPLESSTDPFNSKVPKNKFHTILPKAQPSFHIPTQPPHPSNPEESSPSKLRSFEGCEEPSIKNQDLVVNWGTTTNKKPFPCLECEKSFKTKSELFQHHRVHTGEKPFVCTECGKCFQRKENLTAHIRVHTGEKPFSCGECGKSFSKKGPRDKHMRIHTGEKPFSCSECGKFFSYKMSLSLHQKTHHQTPLKTDSEVL